VDRQAHFLTPEALTESNTMVVAESPVPGNAMSTPALPPAADVEVKKLARDIYALAEALPPRHVPPPPRALIRTEAPHDKLPDSEAGRGGDQHEVRATVLAAGEVKHSAVGRGVAHHESRKNHENSDAALPLHSRSHLHSESGALLMSRRFQKKGKANAILGAAALFMLFIGIITAVCIFKMRKKPKQKSPPQEDKGKDTASPKAKAKAKAKATGKGKGKGTAVDPSAYKAAVERAAVAKKAADEKKVQDQKEKEEKEKKEKEEKEKAEKAKKEQNSDDWWYGEGEEEGYWEGEEWYPGEKPKGPATPKPGDEFPSNEPPPAVSEQPTQTSRFMKNMMRPLGI